MLRYWHLISGGWSITQFPFCLRYRIFILVDNIFYNSPWILPVILSYSQFMIILCLSSNQCLLKYLFIRFIKGLIIYRDNFLIFVIQIFFNLIEFRKASDSQGFLLLYPFFILTFGKLLFSSDTSLPWNALNSFEFPEYRKYHPSRFPVTPAVILAYLFDCRVSFPCKFQFH